MRLNATHTLSGVEAPRYHREQLGAGIVHLGVGAFHRAHQAVYTEAVLNQLGGDWRIIGVSLRSPTVRDQLAAQNFLYTMEVRDGDACRHQVIGALADILVAPENPRAVIDAIAAATTQVITLTITEKGYCLHPDTGELDRHNADVIHDLGAPASPRSALGFLAAALATRMQSGLPGLTLISCDNLSSNGKKLRRGLLDFCEQRDPALGRWVAAMCRFPCSMVDRIVPAVTEADRNSLAARTGYRDEGAVFTEPFSQWVIERDFAGPVPAWDTVGAEYVDDVAPFEEMKLRLLNASHSTIAYVSCIAGIETVSDAINVPSIRRAVERLMREEAAPSLRLPADYDSDGYQQQLLTRFANSALHHRCQQIAMDGSQKIPQRLIPILRYQLNAGGPIAITAFALAAWIRYLQGRDETGNAYTVDDPMAGQFADIFSRHGGDIDDYLPEIRRLGAIFPKDLAGNDALFGLIASYLRGIETRGVLETLDV